MSDVNITRMIERLAKTKLEKALKRQPAVAMIGPREVGKTTLAKKMILSPSMSDIFI